MSLLQQLQANVSRLESAGQTWRSSLLPSLLSLQTCGLATDLHLVTVGHGGVLQEPLLAHSLVLAAASPTLATLLATSRVQEELTLLLPGLEREEMEGVLKDIYLGRDRAGVFLHQLGFLEEDNKMRGDYHGDLVMLSENNKIYIKKVQNKHGFCHKRETYQDPLVTRVFGDPVNLACS